MLSTPLICSSMGVATACSMVCASAPTYLAEIWISGGAISGNCATGSRRMAIAPTMTVKMAITIATIGRLMKNLDIRLWIDPHSLTDFLHAFDDDALTRGKPLVDDPLRADRLSEFNGPDFHSVGIVDNRNLT